MGTPQLLILLLDTCIYLALKIYKEKVSKVMGFVNQVSYKMGGCVWDFMLSNYICLLPFKFAANGRDIEQVMITCILFCAKSSGPGFSKAS